MKCPFCKHEEIVVLESRESEDNEVTRRRRECKRCQKRFTTYERVENISLKIVKKDDRMENYDRAKIKNGLLKACEKSNCSQEDIENIVDDIEMRLMARKTTQVSSSDIGRMILTRLKKLDPVAYLRFASVFLEFTDVQEFKAQIKELS
ncbi:transcriptional regulator NrdR [Patescibacteria group bacterium]|nr:transcriptional regulator NrdR [Patescibacteria group bacterium]MBU1931536.1 transcriptional regulator NrdR [Patescibacteria group bacterium]